jgi:hypothetical protein
MLAMLLTLNTPRLIIAYKQNALEATFSFFNDAIKPDDEPTGSLRSVGRLVRGTSPEAVASSRVP